MSTLKDSKYDGNGGLWLNHGSGHSSIAAQGSIQIGGRKIALTVWKTNRPAPAPDYNITVNEQKTSFEDLVWFKTLHNVDVNTVHDSIVANTPPSLAGTAPIVGRKAEGRGTWQEQTKAIVKPDDEDIPF